MYSIGTGELSEIAIVSNDISSSLMIGFGQILPNIVPSIAIMFLITFVMAILQRR